MVHYIEQSREKYKGYELVLEIYNLDSNNSLKYHRHCRLIKDGKEIAISKTKKELKDLIDHDIYK